MTSVMPNTVGRISGATFMGPGLGAAPGAGCGKAVDVAVWKVTFPSTFFSVWWIWPLSTVTEPKCFKRPSARSASGFGAPDHLIQRVAFRRFGKMREIVGV